MFNITSNSGLIHISSDDYYLRPRIWPVDVSTVMKKVKEQQTDDGITLLLETQSCDIKGAFELCKRLDEEKIKAKVVLKGCCGSFATVLALWADSVSMLTGALCLPIDPTYPIHGYPSVFDPLSSVPRYLNPAEFESLFSFLEKEVPRHSQELHHEIVLSVGSNKLEEAEKRCEVMRDRIKNLMRQKNLNRFEEFAHFITSDCGSFEHWISRRKLEDFGIEVSEEPSFPKCGEVKPIILFPDLQGGFEKKLEVQYQKIADLLNTHVLVIGKNGTMDFNLLKICSDLLWSNRNSFGNKNLTVLLDSYGGSEPNAFALTEVLKDYFPQYQVVVTQDARSSAALFCICSPKVFYRKSSVFGCFGQSIADYSRPGLNISESFIREGLKKVTSEEARLQLIRNLFKVIHPIQIGQVLRAGSLVRELVTEVNQGKIAPNALDFFTREIYPHSYPLTPKEVADLLPLNNFVEVSPELEGLLRKIS